MVDKKEIAKLFYESFGTTVKEIIIEHELKGSGRKPCPSFFQGEVIFRNHANYKKRQFSEDFNRFIRKFAKYFAVGTTWMTDREDRDTVGIAYRWDKERILSAFGFNFRMGRRVMNEPGGYRDGVSQVFYIDINDIELLEEIKKLDDERKAKEDAERQESFPQRKEKALKMCAEISEKAKSYMEGNRMMSEETLDRIANAYFEMCVKP